MSDTTRRDFIKTGAGAVGAGLMLPVINREAKGTTIVQMLRDELEADGKILVVIELAGGNDPLNTIVPLQQYDTYASFRSRIAIPKAQVLPLYGSTAMGLSPNLSAIQPIADAGKLAVMQMCHYPNPNLSHDGSRSIYRQGDASGSVATGGTGWLGRHSTLFGNKTNSLDTVGIGGVNSSLYAPGAKVSGINNDAQGNPSGYLFRTDDRYTGDRNNQLAAARVIDDAQSTKPYIDLSESTGLDALNSADLVAQASATYQSTVTYPTGNNLAAGLKLIAKLATSTAPQLGTRVFYITQGGYDTHADQINDQPALHRALAEAVKAFYDDLAAHNLADKTLIMIWSEFGRRVADNASNGTDHGEANNIYCIGNRVKGGVYGANPNLTDLHNGNLKNNLDFRDVYTTIIQNWFGNSAAEAQQVLNGQFTNLGFLM
ncbi:MAG: DUF1501 domain-containing protein [Acidobacteriota bacterium]